MQILVVEDDDLQVDLYKDWLVRVVAKYNFDSPVVIRIAHDGISADEALSTGTFDIVFLDAFLPGMTGFELYKKHKNKMKCIVLASSCVDEFKRDLLPEGESVYCLNKPFIAEDLDDIFSDMLRKGYIHALLTTDCKGKEYKIIK